jgi:hypothetical protein
MIDGGRLPEVHPASVGAGIEPADPGHAEDGRTSADPEMGPIPERRGFGPQIGSLLLLLLLLLLLFLLLLLLLLLLLWLLLNG